MYYSTVFTKYISCLGIEFYHCLQTCSWLMTDPSLFPSWLLCLQAWPHSSRYRWPAQCNGGHTRLTLCWPAQRNYSAPSARKLAPAIAAPRQVNSSVLWWVLMIMCGHLPSLARVWGGKGSNEFRGGFHIIRRRLLLVLYRCCKNLFRHCKWAFKYGPPNIGIKLKVMWISVPIMCGETMFKSLFRW